MSEVAGADFNPGVLRRSATLFANADRDGDASHRHYLITIMIIGPSFPPGQEIPRSADYRPWCVRDVQTRPIRFSHPFGKPHLN